MRPSSLALAGLALFHVFFTGCSLSLEDPEVEARRKLQTIIPSTAQLLQGRWQGDSTYTIFDTRATSLAGKFSLEVFRDASLEATDSTREVFPGAGVAARITLSNDTLYLQPVGGKGEADTFVVKMRFVGNWLELDRLSDQRYIHLHKLKPPDSTARDSLLKAGLWMRQGIRSAPDTFRIEPLRRNFDYLAFSGDSLYQDTRRDGISRKLAGTLAGKDSGWTWSPPGGAKQFLFDLWQGGDSLRVWPLSAGKADSGYSLYLRTKAHHPFDLDVTAALGHLRSDSIADPFANENHYGRYYDLILGEDHKVTRQTNMPALPHFRSWSIDSGFFWMTADSVNGNDSARSRFRFAYPDSQRKTLSLAADSGPSFSRPTTFYQSIVDGSRFEAHPLERFTNVGYLHIAIGADTLKYYFMPKYRKPAGGVIEQMSLVLISPNDTLVAAWQVNPSLETFQSSQPGFLFAFQGRTGALGRFTCVSDSARNMALRLTATGNASLAQGQLEGDCRLIAADHDMPPDSSLSLTAEFRAKRKTTDWLQDRFWEKP